MDKENIKDIVVGLIEKNNSSHCPINSNDNHVQLCSLELVQLLVELEETFNVEFENKYDSVDEIVHYIYENTVRKYERA